MFERPLQMLVTIVVRASHISLMHSLFLFVFSLGTHTHIIHIRHESFRANEWNRFTQSKWEDQKRKKKLHKPCVLECRNQYSYVNVSVFIGFDFTKYNPSFDWLKRRWFKIRWIFVRFAFFLLCVRVCYDHVSFYSFAIDY